MPVIVELSHSVAIVVPSTVNVTENASRELIESVLLQVQSKLAVAFGGSTTFPGLVGGWIADDGAFVGESVCLVQSYVSDEAWENAPAIMIDLAEWVCSAMAQSCVLIIINGKGKLVSL